jgi:hypothetical protein
MFKALYLPLGEEVEISTHNMNAYIGVGLRPWECAYGLKMPGAMSKLALAPNRFKTAHFETKAVAQDWIMDLITRGSCRDAGMRPEHFEIIEI